MRVIIRQDERDGAGAERTIAGIEGYGPVETRRVNESHKFAGPRIDLGLVPRPNTYQAHAA